MGFADFKKEIISNLESLNVAGKGKIAKQYKLNDDKVSVFSYTKEVNDVVKNKFQDYDSTMKLEDLLKLKFKDGKFADEELTANADDKKLPIVEILNDLINTDEKMKTVLDDNGDKKIDEKEIKAFLDAIKDIDGNKDDISLEDILSGTKAIQDIDLSKFKDTKKQIQNKTTSKPRTTSPARALGAGGVSGAGGGYYGGAPSMVSASSLNQTKGETIEELERKKTEKETEVNNAQETYNQVYSGENKNVKAAQENYETSKENYEKLLEEEKNLTEEQKQQLKDADKKVDDITKSKDNAEVKLQEAKNAVSQQESVVSAAESDLNALKESLSTLQGQTSENPQTQAEITSKISEVQNKISTAENKLNTEKAKLEELKTKQTDAEKELTDKKAELEQAKEEKTKLEQEFIVNNENVSKELKEALQKSNEAQQNVETVKDTEAAAAKSAIDKAQGELEKINNEIEIKKAEETKRENSVSSDLNRPDVFGDNNQYDDLINKYAKQYGVDPLLIKCIIKQESGFNPGATSSVGAGGLMQLMPETAAGLGVSDPYSIEGNLEGGVKYIKQQLDTFGGDVALALAAYNAGPGAVQQYGGVPPYGETQHYVQIITGDYARVRQN